MKKVFTKTLLAAITLVILTLALCSCGVSNKASYISDEQREAHIETLLNGNKPFDENRVRKITSSEGRTLGVTGMIKLTENENFELYVDLDDSSIAVYDIKNDQVYHSDPSNFGYLDEGSRAAIASPLSIEAYDALNKRYEFNFYEDCYEDKNFVIADMKDGSYRFIYTIGNDPNKDLAPPVLTLDTFERLYKVLKDEHPEMTTVLDFAYKLVTPSTITLEEKESLIQYFPTLDWQTLYVRRSLTTRQRASLTEAMRAAGFTAKEVKAEMEKTEYQGPERSVMYTIPVDVRLTEYGLQVNVDSSLILAPTEQRLYKIGLYRGMAASDASNGDEYIIVPDGSGAIIPARGNLMTSAYSERVYGDDETFFRDFDTNVKQSALTAFTAYDRGAAGAMVAIMSEGAAQSFLTARPLNTTSNLTASTNYDIIYCERDYRTYIQKKASSDKTEVVTVSSDTGEGVVLSKDLPKINFTVKYYFMPGGKTYSDYAAFYRDYLIKEGLLPSEKTNENGLSLFVDLYGAVDKNETVVGMPVVKKRALTTYSEAKGILSKLVESGITNIKSRYSYWANGGYYNTTANNLRLIPEMGSASELSDLVSYCKDNAISLYPSAEFISIYRECMGDGIDYQNDVARRLDLKISRTNIRLRMSGLLIESSDDTYKSVISPDLLPGFAESYKKSYESTVGLQNIALGSIGKYLDTNYKTNRISNREVTLGYNKAVLDTFADYSIAVTHGNDYTWKYADAIFEVPMGSSESLSASKSIPFIQMVLHGYVPYSGKAINVSGDYETEFLKAIETGSNPSIRWMDENDTIFDNTKFYDFYSLNYNLTYDKTVDFYNRLNSVMKDVVNLPITKHEDVVAAYKDSGLPADNVFATTYGDSKTFIINYNNTDVTTQDGTTVPAKSYVAK